MTEASTSQTHVMAVVSRYVLDICNARFNGVDEESEFLMKTSYLLKFPPQRENGQLRISVVLPQRGGIKMGSLLKVPWA